MCVIMEAPSHSFSPQDVLLERTIAAAITTELAKLGLPHLTVDQRVRLCNCSVQRTTRASKGFCTSRSTKRVHLGATGPKELSLST
jgi:hypothetical protein